MAAGLDHATYEEALLEPAKQFVVAMGRDLHRISPKIIAEPRVNGWGGRQYRKNSFHDHS